MDIRPIFCTACGGRIVLGDESKLSFCPWCGTQLYFNDGSITINFNQNFRDEARLRELQLYEQEQVLKRERDEAEVAARQRTGRVLLKVGVWLIIAATVLIAMVVLWRPVIVLIIIITVLLSCGIPFTACGGTMMHDERTRAQRHADRLEKQRQIHELAILEAEEERIRVEIEERERLADERNRREKKKERRECKKETNLITDLVKAGFAAALIKKILK